MREKHDTLLQAGLAELDDLGEKVGLLLSKQSHSHKLGEQAGLQSASVEPFLE